MFCADCVACTVPFFAVQPGRDRAQEILLGIANLPRNQPCASWDRFGPAPRGCGRNGAPRGPVLKAETRRDSALDCHAGLASGTARMLGGARRQFRLRRLQIGHGIDPSQGQDWRLLKPDSGAGVPAPPGWPVIFVGSGLVLPDSLRRVTNHSALPNFLPKKSIATAAPISIAATVAPLRTASRESPKSYTATYHSVIAT
jgi:hypothetical protein